MKGRGPLFVPGEKESQTFRARGELRTGLGTGHLLGTAPERPPSCIPSDATSASFPLFPLSNRDKLGIVLHVILGQRSQKSVTQRNFHYSSLNLELQGHVMWKNGVPTALLGKDTHFFQIFLQYLHSSHSAVCYIANFCLGTLNLLFWSVISLSIQRLTHLKH